MPASMIGQSRHSIDSLAQYSYFLLGFDSSQKEVSNGTCFFIRQDKKTYLVTAYHMLANCNNYDSGATKFKYPNVSLGLRYQHPNGKYDIRFIPMDAFKDTVRRIFTEYPDVDTLDVSNFVGDLQIKSVEDMINLPPHANAEKMICWGYPGVEVDNARPVKCDKDSNSTNKKWLHIPKKHPHGWIGKTINNPKDSVFADTVNNMYFSINQISAPGLSGAPIFRIIKSNGQTSYELAGIQSGSDSIHKTSLAVYTSQLINRLHYNKR